MRKLSIYFGIKRYLHLSNMCYDVNIDYFLLTICTATFWLTA